jgi:Zn-dependent M32 family carboxypeptidase
MAKKRTTKKEKPKEVKDERVEEIIQKSEEAVTEKRPKMDYTELTEYLEPVMRIINLHISPKGVVRMEAVLN